MEYNSSEYTSVVILVFEKCNFNILVNVNSEGFDKMEPSDSAKSVSEL